MIEPLLLLACLLASALASGTEIALIAADRFRLRTLAKARHATVELSLDLLKRRDKILSTLLIGSTLANAAAAAMATALVERRLDPPVSTVLTTVGVTILVLIFAEIVPKSIGRTHSEAVLMGASRPLFALDLLLLPVTVAIDAGVGWIVKVLGGNKGNLVTREDLKLLAQKVQNETGPVRQERRMLQSILDFGRTTAREVMVPMPSVVSIDQEASGEMLRALLKRHGYTRIPVFDRRVDRIVGVVHLFDLLLDPEGGESIASLMRTITLVPETKRIDRLMVEMQRRGEAMVVVVNEFGSCTGIVTMEDIVEEIMGELADEHEVGVKRIRSIGNRAYIVDALTDIDDLNEELGLDLPKLRYDTIGGLVLRRLGRIPQEGDRFTLSEATIEVVEVYAYGVRTVKLTLEPKKEESR